MNPEAKTTYAPSAEPLLFYVVKQGATPEDLEHAVRSASYEDHVAAIKRAIERPGFRDVETANAALGVLETAVAQEFREVTARQVQLDLDPTALTA